MSLDLFRVSGGIQIDQSTQILEGAAAPSVDAPIGSVYTETTTGGLYTKVTAGSGADKWELVATKDYVDGEITTVNNRIDALGDVFEYVGLVDGGATGSATDLALLTQKSAGDYYKVGTAGYFKIGEGAEFYANVGDGLVWNTTGVIDKIDNTNSDVQGTADYVTVTGSTDAGFVVDVAEAFKTRVSAAEGDIADIRSFVGAADGDIAPTYTSAAVVTQGGSLEAAVGELDAAVDGVQTAVERDGKLTTGSATSLTDTVATVAAKWIVHVDDGAGNAAAYEVFAASNGTTVDFTRFALLRIGTAIDGLDVTATQSGADIVLTVSATNAVNIKIKRVAVI